MMRVRIRQPKQYFPRIRPFERYRDEKFIHRYRLTKETVRELAQSYENSGFCNVLTGRGGAIPPEDRMCLAIRYFATGSNFSLIGDYQGIEKATVSRIVTEVSNFFYNKQQEYIKFPNTWEEKYEIAREFYDKFAEKPFVLGCVDGTHIPIIRPSNNEAAFANRKKFHSINTMIVCDANKRIIHVDPRWPGSVNDSYVIRNSQLWERGEAGQLGQYYLLGDSGYPVQPFLFTPLLRPTSASQERYNIWHKRTRATVESTIGILKQRFRCIDDSGGYLHHKPEKCAKIITSCVCLHNVARNTNMPDPQPLLDDDPDAVRPVRAPREQPQNDFGDIGARHRRFGNAREEFIQKHF